MLRVPDELHARLKARAQREGRSVNAMVTEILNTAEADETADEHADRRAALRAKVEALGMAPPPRPPVRQLTDEEREAALATMKGLGPGVADREIAYERNRL